MNYVVEDYLDARDCTKEDVKNEKHPAVLNLKDWAELQRKTMKQNHAMEYVQTAVDEELDSFASNINNTGLSNLVGVQFLDTSENIQYGYEQYLDYLTDDLYETEYVDEQLIKLEFKSMDEAKEYYGSYWDELNEVFEGNLKEW